MTDNLPTGRKLRVAILGIYHESNTFINKATTLQDFTNGHWLKGEAILREYRNAFHEIGGMLEVLDQNDIHAIPLMFAEATPGGTISAVTYKYLLNEMIDGLKNILPVDACLVVPHGAGVADGYPDMDGHWLSIVRKTVGDDIPIIGTLDPHANASPLMVNSTNALIAYKTNPHVDQRETGKSAAELLIQTLNRKIRPVQVLIQTPVAISIEQQYTSAEPCQSLYQLAREISQQPGILSISILLGFPYADVEEMGSSFIVVSDNNYNNAQSAGSNLKSALIKIKENCVGTKNNIDSALPELSHKEKPVLLLDIGDNIGGGSMGDSAYLLKALEDDDSYKSFICIYDPEAVEVCAGHTKNDKFELSFGNIDATDGGRKYVTDVKLIHTGDGKFRESNPRHGGQTNYDMGKIAIVETGCGNMVMLNSLRVPPFSLSQLTTFNIVPSDFDVIVAKGVNAPIAAYSPVCPTIVQINTPGLTQSDMTLFTYKNRRKPLFPFEN